MSTPSPVEPTMLGHYRIVEKIGEGGMGIVYRAHDERLDRDVALKILPVGILSDEAARKRFRKEALALSKLNHPTISAVYDFDTQDGIDFLVMEYIPGMTLDERISQGHLSDREILEVSAQFVEGLTLAHEQNIVHRDLKPGNLRITPEGRVKILDFGLATLARPTYAAVSTASLTETQGAGTLPYMAPEQLQGQAADVRSDIWAVGVVLYEMGTGRPPFAAKLPSALTDEILHEPVRPPSRLNATLSARLEDVILKCLEKNPANRYQSSKELLVDLRRLASPSTQLVKTEAGSRAGWRTAVVSFAAMIVVVAAIVGLYPAVKSWWQGSPGIDAIAVLPLANRSQDPEQEYFADGVTEALIGELSRIKALKVISMTSAMRYKDTKKSVPQIAQELGVSGIVEGSVTRVGDHVRVTAELIEAKGDRQIWSEVYDRDVRDLLNLQTELARAISAQIRVKLTPQESARLDSVRHVVPEAHEAYLKGRYFANRAASTKAIPWFQEAINKDPGYAAAYGELALQYAFAVPAHQFMPKAKAAALRAVELDPSLAEGHIALGTIALLYEWQWAQSEKELLRALELDPGSASAHSQYAYYLLAMARLDDAVAEAHRALMLDPLSLSLNMGYGRALFFARRYDEAIASFKKTLELDSNFAPVWMFLGLAEEQKGQYAEAIAHVSRAFGHTETGEFPQAAGEPGDLSGVRTLSRTLVASYASQGYVGALKAWGKYWEAGVVQGTVQPTSVAMVYARAGEKEKAFQYLEQGFREHARSIVYLKSEPQFDNLRSDSRFSDLMRRIGLPN